MDIVLVVALIVIGIISILLEIFIIPGLTIFGIIGFLLLIGATVYSYIELGAFFGSMSLIMSITSVFILLRIVLKSRRIKSLILSTSESKEDGYTSSDSKYEGLIGKIGVTATKLRPAGKAEIEDATYDVVSDGEFINTGENIRVKKIEGFRIVVEKETNGPETV